MGAGAGSTVRLPSTAGSHAGRKNEKASTYEGQPWLDVVAKERRCATIYFATDRSDLGLDDVSALGRLAIALRLVLREARALLTVRCVGYADARGTESHNAGLSKQRADTVAAFLQGQMTARHRVTFETEAKGATGSLTLPEAWAENRRVEVIAWGILDPSEQIKYGKLRADLFHKHYPRYWFWRNRGLDHLIEEYEIHDQDSVPVKVKPEDVKGVTGILETLADHDDFHMIQNWITAEPRLEARLDLISQAYGVEYRKAYEEARERAKAAGETL